MQLRLMRGEESLALNGRLEEKAGLPGAEGALDCAVEIALDGGAAQCAEWVSGAGRMLEEGRRAFGLPGRTQTYLEATLPATGAWRSPVMAGRARSLGSGGRGLGGEGVRLDLRRVDWWESAAPVNLTLTNRYGGGLPGARRVDNALDDWHDNYVEISAADVGGDLPAPLTLTLESPGLAGADVLAGLDSGPGVWTLAGCSESSAAAPGAGVTRVNFDTPLASGGSTARLTWSGADPTALLTWTWNEQQTRAAGGRVFHPLARLHTLFGAETVWLWLRLGCAGVTLAESAPAAVDPAAQRARLAALAVPPWAVGDLADPSRPVEVTLVAQGSAAGSRTLDLDALLWLPSDGFVHYLPLLPSADLSLVHESESGLVRQAGLLFGSHAPEGPGIWLKPGVNQRLYLNWVDGSGQWMVASTLNASGQYRPRRRSL